MDVQSVRGCKTSAMNDLKESSQKPNDDHSNINIQCNSNVIKMDVTSEGQEDELAPPFTFVAVKNEVIDDEQGASCFSDSQLNSSCEETTLFGDMTKVIDVQGQREFQSDSEVMSGIKEENEGCILGFELTENVSFTNDTRQLCDGLSTTKEDSVMATKNICGAQGPHIVETVGSDYSEGCFVRRTEFDSICDISKSDLKEEKLFEAVKCSDVNNYHLTCNGVSETLKFEDGECIYKEQDVPNTERPRLLRQARVVLERTSTRYQINNLSGREISSRTSRMQAKQTKDEMELEKSGQVDQEYANFSQHDVEMKYDQEDINANFTEHFQDTTCIGTYEHSSGVKHLSNICGGSFNRCGNVEADVRDKPFPCSVCELSFRKRYLLKLHMQTHTGEKPFKCNVCEFSFCRNFNLRRHMLTHTGKKPYKCDMCEFTSSYSDSLKSHRRRHTGEKLFKCLICEASFCRKNTLNKHIEIHATDKPFKCNVCEASFCLSVNLKFHSRVHTAKDLLKCDVCKNTFSTKFTLKIHKRIHTGKKLFNCEICGSSFHRSDVLKLHIKSHSAEKPFKCDLCPISFHRSSNLRTHMRSHTGEKPFMCDVCFMSFSYKSSLGRHMETHSEVKQYECDICKSSFSQRNGLVNHIQTLSSTKPHTCDTCGAAFHKRSTLKRHVSSKHTREKPFKCDLCSAAYYEKYELNKHTRSHTGEKTFKCKICEAAFSRKAGLTAHIQTHSR